MTEEVKTDEARGGVTSRKHKVARVLIASLVLVAVAWFVVEWFWGGPTL